VVMILRRSVWQISGEELRQAGEDLWTPGSHTDPQSFSLGPFSPDLWTFRFYSTALEARKRLPFSEKPVAGSSNDLGSPKLKQKYAGASRCPFCARCGHLRNYIVP
jgi:hypothetical protein